MNAPTTRQFVNDLLERTVNVPATTMKATRRLVLDVLGIAAAGSATQEGRTVLATMSAAGRQGSHPVPLGTEGLDIGASVLVSGTMAYSLGLTDTHSQSITHPGSSIVPVALAVGRAAGADDDAILRAIVAGVETVVRIGGVVNPSHRARGFHPTATCNPFGTAVAASILLDADLDQTLSAMGIAGSMAGGLYEFRHAGSMLMALHGGWPAQAGLTAAQLADQGFTGPHTVLEGPEGFFHGFADAIRPEQLAVAPGDSWGVDELSLRPYNACRYAHAGIDALALIEDEHGRIEPEAVRSITIWTHRTAVDQESEPTTLVAARLSTAFTIALTFVHGPRLDEMTVDDLRDPAVQQLLTRTHIREDERLTELFPRLWACRVDLELNDGRVLTAEVMTPRGDPSNPMSAREITEKFTRLAAPRMGEDRTAEIVTRVIGGDAPLAGALDSMASGHIRAGAL